MNSRKPASLLFDPRALKEWRGLDSAVRSRFKKKLSNRLLEPRNESAALKGELAGCFKIRDHAAGLRLVYAYLEDVNTVWVLSINQRAKLKVYEDALKRWADYST